MDAVDEESDEKSERVRARSNAIQVDRMYHFSMHGDRGRFNEGQLLSCSKAALFARAACPDLQSSFPLAYFVTGAYSRIRNVPLAEVSPRFSVAVSKPGKPE